MPTVRPRHQITETAAVAHALDLAARRWPGEPRSKLLLRLINAGESLLEEHEHKVDEKRRESIRASCGKYTNAFGPDYLTNLRQDWPA